MYRSNCILEALRMYLRNPGTFGDESYVWWRRSRHPGGVFHMGFGIRDPNTDQMRMYSFKPLKPRRHPWWMLPLLFEGQIMEGDRHVPVDLPPLPTWQRVVGWILSAVLLFTVGLLINVLNLNEVGEKP